MTEAVTIFLYERIPRIISAGFGMGSFVAISAILLGYAIGKALSLVDNT